MLNKHLQILFCSMLSAMMLVLSVPAQAQDTREIEMIAELGVEIIAEREAATAAAIEAEHHRLLEEQSKLKQMYQDYLGEARRTAQALINSRRQAITQDKVEAVRSQAMSVIASVDDATKNRVRTELDKYYEQLEQAIAITPDQLLGSSPQLNTAYKKLGRNNDLDWVNRTAILYALCPSIEEAKAIASNVKFREQLSEDEAMAIDECNRRRLVLGLRPVAVDMKLVACGRDHSKDMIDNDFFDHVSPVPGKEKFTDRAKNFGTTASGENIAAGYADGMAVTLGWWYSPGHLKNMMNRGWKRVGVGQTQKHYTQLFGR